MRKNKFLILLWSGLAPLFIMLGAWFFNDFYPFGTKSFLAIDFNQQFVDLYIFMRNTIRSGDWGSFFYSFTKSLGGNMVGAWAYYLMSPFNLIYLLVPVDHISYAVFFSVWLRYGAMGLAMAHYLVKRHNGGESPYLTIALSSAYALNGFAVSYQMTPIFMDALWLMPLLLVALEEVLDGRSPIKYILLLAITMVVQYYMGYMICLFIFMYTFYYLFIHSQNFSFQYMLGKVMRLGGYSLLAIGLSAFLMLPNIYNLLNSKAALESTLSFDWELQINPLDIFSKYMIGAFDNQSWSSGPNLPNLYMGSLAAFGTFIYFISDKIKRSHKLASLVVLMIFFFSITHEFTSKIWHMGQNPAGFFYRFSWIVIFFLLVLAFQGLQNRMIKSQDVFIGLSLMFMVHAIVMAKEYSFLSAEQQQLSALCFGLICLILYFVKGSVLKGILLIFLTFTELGVNAYYSQEDINHNNAFKFENALSVIDQAIDEVRPDQNDFYRISKTFYRSKNDPMTFNYPGLTNFSSSLEGTTRDLYERLGNSGIDASVYYYGTPLTDALLGVKYFVNNEPFSANSQKEMDKTYVFPSDVTRKDIVHPNNLVGKTDRFSLYQVQNTLPIAFGISDAAMNLTLQDNMPILNQNAIGQALTGNKELLFEEVPIKKEVSNLKQGLTESGDQIFSREDPSQDSSMRITLTADTDDAYFITIPQSLSTHDSEVELYLNGEEFDYRSKFGSDQFFNIAYQEQGQELEFKIDIKADRQFNMTNLKVVKFNQKEFEKLVKSKKQEALDLKSWGSNYVRGTIKIAESPWVFTSIPFDKGWQVKVDGQKVETQAVWDSLLAFPIDAGQHEIEMTFIPQGLILGILLSIGSLVAFLLLIFYRKRHGF